MWMTLAMLSLASCLFQRGVPEPLPAIPVYEITPREEGAGVSISPSRSGDPLADLGATKRVSLTANMADVRALLLWLAREAGVSLLVAPDVSARVSVSFNNVPAVDAMRAIISQAGLSVLTSGLQTPWPPVVFHQLPVNIDEASAETLAARFGVSLEMAKWIVDARPQL
jgi:hypothetical protein